MRKGSQQAVTTYNQTPDFRIGEVGLAIENRFRCSDIKHGERTDTTADEESAGNDTPFPFILMIR